jgi:Zn finger protein HypA/HybF involved in hydrogenase expression
MPIDDPSSWAQGFTALKMAFDSARSAFSMAKEVWSRGGGTEQEQKAIESALTIASSNTALAEAKIAVSLGYELCKCEFPPTPMRTVGYFNRRTENNKEGDPVYECPKCGYNNAGPYGFARITPEQTSK